MKDEIPGDFRSQRTGPANAGLAGVVTNGLRFRFDVWSEVEKNPLISVGMMHYCIGHGSMLLNFIYIQRSLKREGLARVHASV